MSKTTKDKIDEIWLANRRYSAEASKVARQFAFGEGAIFWVFFHEDKNFSFIIVAGVFF